MSKKNDLSGYILGTIIAYWSITASFFSLIIPVRFSLFIVLTFILILAINSRRYIVDGRLFISCVIIIIPYLTYYKLTNPGDWYSTLIYPAIILFVYYAYKFNGWEKIAIRIMLIGYLLYAIYTIGMLFNGNLINISCALFPVSAESMILRYNTARFCGLTNHYSTNGMLLAVGMIISGCKIMQKKTKWNFIIFIIFTVAILLTGKRAQPIFSVIALLCVYYFYNADKKKGRLFKILSIIMALIALSYIIIQYIPSLASMFDRFAALEESGDVSNGRYELWNMALQQFKKSPIFGIGWEQYSLLQKSGWESHNVYIQLLCETGVIGVIVYIIWFAWFLVHSIILLAQTRTGIFKLDVDNEFYLMFSVAIQVFFLIYSLTGNPLYTKIMYVPYFMACAITMNIFKIKNNQTIR